MEYKIVHACSLFSLPKAIERVTRAVSELIAQGWEPVGGVTVSDYGLVAQAMLKRR